MKHDSVARLGIFVMVCMMMIGTVPALAQDGSPEPYPAGPIGAAAGSGPYPAIAEARSDAPGYTIYRPAQAPGFKLPLVLWGNGGCRDNGLSASHFLREIASHGYFVVANGSAREEREVLAELPDVSEAPPAPTEGPVRPQRTTPDETSVRQMLGAIDWAEAADADPQNSYFDMIDTARVAALGHSCGGLQALSAGLDPRIDTVLALASGVYSVDQSPPGNVEILQSDLAGLHSPIGIILGGPSDIAYPHGTRNFELIDHVPVLAASLPVGHGGTFQMQNGGEWATVATAWLDWQIKGSHAAARWFVGEDCLLCRDEDWDLSRKMFPHRP